MAITTLAQLERAIIEPVAFNRASNPGNGSICKTLWAAGSWPAAGTYSASIDGVTCDNTTTGALPFINPASGNTYLARMSMMQTGANQNYFLWDRIWHNGNYDATLTSAQNSTTPTWPARDKNGSTNGAGVYLALEISAAMGAGTPTVTITYTNSDGTGSKTGINILDTVTTANAATLYQIGVASGDIGVRSVQSLQLSATWTSGTMNLTAYRHVAMMPNTVLYDAAEPCVFDALAYGARRIYDSSCLYMTRLGNTQSGDVPRGVMHLAQG